MSLGVEVVLMEGIDLQSTPPCEAITTYQNANHPPWAPDEPCDQPSCSRVKLTCHKCGAARILFVCPEHLWDFLRGTARCRTCRVLGSYEVKEI